MPNPDFSENVRSTFRMGFIVETAATMGFTGPLRVTPRG